jgi:mannose-6-phosphate isomerase-like protein (cupin superfamily)
MMTSTATSYMLTRDEGPMFWSVGVLARIKATGEQSGGRFALVDEWCPPGYATPLHIHHAEDEAFYVLEGEATVFCADERIRAGAGTYVFAPRHVPHGFRVEGEIPARLLILTAPSGFEQFLMEMGEHISTPTDVMGTPPDLERLAQVAGKYKIEVLGPLPE